MVTDKPVAYKAAAVNPELEPFPIAIDTDDYAYIFRKGSELAEEVNSALQYSQQKDETEITFAGELINGGLIDKADAISMDIVKKSVKDISAADNKLIISL